MSEKPSSIISLDERFLEEFKAEIEKVFFDLIPEFNIDKICRNLYVSRSTLYRRIKEITGKTPHSLVIEYRLERAAELLKTNAGNVTEVAAIVGFSNKDYFTRLFKEKFKQSPKTYQLSFRKGVSTQDYSMEEVQPQEESQERGVTLMLQISIEDIDRELSFRIPLPKLEELFKSAVDKQQRDELYQFIKNIYDQNSSAHSDGKDMVKNFQIPEILKKIRENIENLKEDVYR